MAGGYSVTISATDSTAPALEAINKRFAAMNRRVAEATAPFKRLADQMNRFTEVTGIDKIATGFKNFGTAAGETWRSVSRVVEPLAAITGAASIAGIVRLTQAWADFGTTLGNQAARARVSADQLYTLQNAARLAGVDAGTLTSGLTALNDRMRDAAFGGAPMFLTTLRTIGLSFEDLQRQKPEERLRTIADALSRVQNPTDRALYTREMFGGEGMQAFLRGGAEGIARYEQQARRLAGVFSEDDVRRANEFRQAQAGLALSVMGLGFSIGAVLGPALTPALNSMSGIAAQARAWVEANKDWLRNEISAKVGEFVTWLKQVDWVGLGQWIADVARQANAVADALGGWETVGKEVLAFFVGRWLIGMLVPFVTLGVAVGKLTWMIGVGLVASLRAAGTAAEAFNTRAMALPVFRVLAATMGLVDTMRNGVPVDQLPADSPLRRVGPQEDGGDGGSESGGFLGRVGRFLGLTPRNASAGGSVGISPNAIPPGDRAAILAQAVAGTAIPPRFFDALISQESGWDANRRRPGGTDLGLGQITNSTAADPGFGMSPISEADRRDPNVAARWSAQSLYARARAAGISDAELQTPQGFGRAAALYNGGGDPDYAAHVLGRVGRTGTLFPGAPPFDPNRPSLTASRNDPRLPDASGAPAPLPSSQPGAPGANGKVDMNVRVLGQPAVVTSRTSGDVDLKVVSPALTGY